MSIKNLLAVLQANGNSQQEILERRLLEMIVLEQSNFVFTNLGTKTEIPMNAGTTTKKLRRYNSLPVGDHKLEEGVAPDALKVEGHTITASVDQFGAYIDVSDVGDAINLEDILTVYQPELARHAAEVVERNTIASLTDTSEYFCGTGNTTKAQLASTDILTFQDLRLVGLSMKNYRRQGHTKTGGKPLVVCHTNVMQDLLDDTDLENKILATGQENAPIKNGTLENYKVFGLFVQETLIAPVEKVNIGTVETPVYLNVYTTFVLGKDSYTVLSMGSVKWIKRDFVADSGNPLAQSASVGYKLWTGAKVIDPLAITKVYSACSYDIVPDFTDDDWGATASQV